VLNYSPVRLARAILVRLLFGALSLIFISFVTFVADELSPGDAATVLAGEKASPQRVAQLRREMGLDRAWPIRYVEFLGVAPRQLRPEERVAGQPDRRFGGILQGDFGRSYYGTREPVSEILVRTVPMTARIAFMAITLAALIGITLGTIAAVYQNRAADRTVLSLSTLGVTIPTFVLAPLLVYVFVIQLDQLPLTWTVDRVAPDIVYLILPVSIIAARSMALLTRLTRASMIDTMQQEFIRTAVAKGVPRMRLILRHALRNAILPVITAIGTSFGFLLTGSFVIETYFTIPGLGSTTIEAIRRGDMPVVQAGVFVTGAVFIFLNLIVDLILPLLDPRIRESQI
jgi:peptide/nickel transport system permease protein